MHPCVLAFHAKLSKIGGHLLEQNVCDEHWLIRKSWSILSNVVDQQTSDEYINYLDMNKLCRTKLLLSQATNK
jgi:hypothetical protein